MRSSVRPQAGENWRMPLTKSTTESVPSWSLSINWSKTLASRSFNSVDNNAACTCSRVSPCLLCLRLSSKALTTASFMARERCRTFSRRLSRSSDGSDRPMAQKKPHRVTLPEPSTSISENTFFASFSLKFKVRTALATNSWRSMEPQRLISNSKKARSKSPLYFRNIRSRRSSSKSMGDTAATALVSSAKEVVRPRSPEIVLKIACCSPRSATFTALSKRPNSSNSSRCKVVTPASIFLIALDIDVKPAASHLRRRSDSVRMGADASTAMANSSMVIFPIPRKSSCRTTSSHSSGVVHSMPCAARARHNSRFDREREFRASRARQRKAPSTVGKHS
mmetsp:Transcript_68153/g.134556  ORF Transcript_68153/g.134556 Transcript_68153/m.134556 type:complete len:337 (-) Transcript_68153:1023-2033(-)